MIIPVKCFTCGMVLADKYRFYQNEVRRIKISQGADVNKVVYLTKEKVEKTPEGIVLDDLGLHNVCCRRHMLTHVDIEWTPYVLGVFYTFSHWKCANATLPFTHLRPQSGRFEWEKVYNIVFYFLWS